MNPTNDASVPELVDHFFRHASGRMTAVLTRIFGAQHLDLVEDVVQDALLQALRRWPIHGIPEKPEAWLIQTAKNKALDALRRKSAFQEVSTDWVAALAAPAEDQPVFSSEIDHDRLLLMFLCCPPGMPVESRVALILKAACGFSAAEIARAFMAKEATVAQRLVRAKRFLREHPDNMATPPPSELFERRAVVLEALYAMFNEGYSAQRGDVLVRHDICEEAFAICTALVRHRDLGAPDAHALAALMAFQLARFPVRLREDGTPRPLAEQDRSRWDQAAIRRGLRHFEQAAEGKHLTIYHLEAEIAFFHISAPNEKQTDWRGILAKYDQLMELKSSPVVQLNRAIAVSKVQGAEPALENLRDLENDLRDYVPFHLTKASFLNDLGRWSEATACFRQALACRPSEPVRRFIEDKMASSYSGN